MKVFALFVLSIAAVYVLTACGGAAATPVPTAGSATTVRLIVPRADNLQYLNFWVAVGAGFFKEEGLDVQVVVPPSPRLGAQFLLQGQGDVALLQPSMYIEQIAQKQPVLVFANLLQNDPINLVVRKEVAEARKLSPDAPLAERLKGLQGLKVGVAPNPPTRLRILFASVGMDIDKDIQVVILGEEIYQAFEGNPIDALYAHTPFLEKALAEQGAVLLVNQSRGDIPELAGLAIHALVTTRQFAASKPEVVLALTRGVYRAQQLIHTDLKAAEDALFRSGVPGLQPHLVEALLPIYQPAIPWTPEVSVEAIKKSNENIFPVRQPPQDLTKVNLSDYIAPQFTRQAVERSR
ncbi:MAG: ABC transporter substrate-binding protein [Chloroflexi bacterium]|nr:ABC transporter substrate-binding protein [Chloroflexota bacterium]